LEKNATAEKQDIQPYIRSGAIATPRPSPSSKMAGYTRFIDS
jgi:hypothetical protein